MEINKKKPIYKEQASSLGKSNLPKRTKINSGGTDGRWGENVSLLQYIIIKHTAVRYKPRSHLFLNLAFNK